MEINNFEKKVEKIKSYLASLLDLRTMNNLPDKEYKIEALARNKAYAMVIDIINTLLDDSNSEKLFEPDFNLDEIIVNKEGESPQK